MSITPLYTKEELDTEIAQAKKDLAAARRMLSYGRQSGQQVQREKIKDLQEHLAWLQKQRMALEGVTGPQAIVGRAYRG